MKKLILCTLMTAFELVSFAQQHLTFKGVPINDSEKVHQNAIDDL